MIVKRLFASFGYEQLMICCQQEKIQGSLLVSEVPRDFVRALENELVELSGKGQDNKTSYVFEDHMHDTYAISFWDNTAYFIRWSAHHWNCVPMNLSIRKDWTLARKYPTPAEIGLPSKEEWFND